VLGGFRSLDAVMEEARAREEMSRVAHWRSVATHPNSDHAGMFEWEEVGPIANNHAADPLKNRSGDIAMFRSQGYETASVSSVIENTHTYYMRRIREHALFDAARLGTGK
jgi:hypothetical protein